jgi:hypothetical protein
MLASTLVATGAGVIFALGVIHLAYTYFTPKLSPRAPGLRSQMEASSLVIARRTTVWRAWVGFNASHSVGAMFFGSVYAYLALRHGALLFGSPFLGGCGIALLLTYLTLAKLYWFHIPCRSIALATLLYAAGFAVALLS